jgi:Zn-dependent protease with chaperone function
MTGVLVAVLLLWFAFNLLAPWAVLAYSEPMSMGRVPQRIAGVAREMDVRLYTSALDSPGGFSVLAWPRTIVVFDRDSLARQPADALRFLMAHELGHCALGHLVERWWYTVTGLALLPVVQRRLLSMEREADRYAEALTGIAAESFYNPRRPTHEDVARTGTSTT